MRARPPYLTALNSGYPSSQSNVRRQPGQQTTLLRCGSHHCSDSTIEERPWVLHWYPQDQFEKLAKGKPAPADDTDLVHFRLQAA